MAKLYGFGAAIVILGALFKIQHWPLAGTFLTLGLVTEATIFFFSAFEPPHAEPDWTLVYPELAGMYDDELKEELESDRKRQQQVHGDAISQQLDKMLEDAKIGPELLESLGKSFETLSENTGKFASLSNATVATEEYVSNMHGASEKAQQLSDSYNKTAEILNNDATASESYLQSLQSAATSMNNLSETYARADEVFKNDITANEEFVSSIKSAAESVNELKEKYVQSSEALARSAEAIDLTKIDGSEYADQLQEISKNLAALNAVYALQLQSSNDQLQNTNSLQEKMGEFIDNIQASSDNSLRFKENLSALNSAFEQQISNISEQGEKTTALYDGMDKFIEDLKASSSNTKQFQDELVSLTRNISALNNIYGNMLSAMNFNQEQNT